MSALLARPAQLRCCEFASTHLAKLRLSTLNFSRCSADWPVTTSRRCLQCTRTHCEKLLPSARFFTRSTTRASLALRARRIAVPAAHARQLHPSSRWKNFPIARFLFSRARAAASSEIAAARAPALALLWLKEVPAHHWAQHVFASALATPPRTADLSIAAWASSTRSRSATIAASSSLKPPSPLASLSGGGGGPGGAVRVSTAPSQLVSKASSLPSPVVSCPSTGTTGRRCACRLSVSQPAAGSGSQARGAGRRQRPGRPAAAAGGGGAENGRGGGAADLAGRCDATLPAPLLAELPALLPRLVGPPRRPTATPRPPLAPSSACKLGLARSSSTSRCCFSKSRQSLPCSVRASMAAGAAGRSAGGQLAAGRHHSICLQARLSSDSRPFGTTIKYYYKELFCATIDVDQSKMATDTLK